MEYNKLVRDKIPEIIIDKHGENSLDIKELKDKRDILIYSLNKLIEEAYELKDAVMNDASDSLEELADVVCALKKVQKELGYTDENVEAACIIKTANKGGFEHNFVLKEVRT